MAKTKNKNHNETKLLRERIRELEKQVRTLNKQLGYYKKHQHLFENTKIDEEVEEETMEQEIMTKGITCDHCGKGKYVEFEILDKVFGTCNTCGDRKKLK